MKYSTNDYQRRFYEIIKQEKEVLEDKVRMRRGDTLSARIYENLFSKFLTHATQEVEILNIQKIYIYIDISKNL
jgi:hypothetical protein